MRNKLVILSILAVIALALYLGMSHMAKDLNGTTPIEIDAFLNSNGYIIPESERGNLDISVKQFNDDMYEVVLKYDGLHDDSVSGMEKTLLLEQIDAPEKFKVVKDTTEYVCSRGKNNNGLCI